MLAATSLGERRGAGRKGAERRGGEDREKLAKQLDEFVRSTPAQQAERWDRVLRGCSSDSQEALLARLWDLSPDETRLKRLRQLLSKAKLADRAELATEVCMSWDGRMVAIRYTYTTFRQKALLHFLTPEGIGKLHLGSKLA